MGRSRLAYRSKHKGILSENSRKAIQEAHQKKKASEDNQSKAIVSERAWTEKEDETQTLSETSEELEDELSIIDIMDFSPIFVRDREIADYQQEIGLDGLVDRKQDLFFPNSTDVIRCFQSVPLNSILDRAEYDENEQTVFDDLDKSGFQQKGQSSISSSSQDYGKDNQSNESITSTELSSSKIEMKQTSLMDEIDALLGF